MLAIIDGDMLIYRCGFAAQQTKYVLTYEDYTQICSTRRKKDKFIEKNGDPKEVEVIKKIESLPNALYGVKLLLYKILRDTNADTYIVYLSGSKEVNFRYNLATIKEYKGNRKNKAKPYYFSSIYEYLKSEWYAEVADWGEADDSISIHHYKTWEQKNSVICSLDKDLNTVPGLHYNWLRGEVVDITEQEAMKNFYTQILTGDDSDSIPGCPGIGPANAAKILKGKETEEEMLRAVYKSFKKKLELDEDKTKAYIKEIGQLLWMSREKGKIWEMPEVEYDQ